LLSRIILTNPFPEINVRRLEGLSMEIILDVLRVIGTSVGIISIVLLCMVAVLLSCVSISGTWVVLGASLIALLMRGEATFPGWLTLILFLLLSIAIECAEAVAGSWGVTRRGGSKLAGMAALAGGLLGLFVGVVIPIPLVGPLIGMLVLSFAAAFMVEQWRLKRIEHAVHIAWGAVLARVWVIFLKVAVTLGMVAVLLLGMIFCRLG
jgi:uncharacterized protein YqgC (DUF456 family)